MVVDVSDAIGASMLLITFNPRIIAEAVAIVDRLLYDFTLLHELCGNLGDDVMKAA
jgi:hypothetical protein